MKAQYQKKLEELRRLMEKADDMRQTEIRFIDWEDGTSYNKLDVYAWDENVAKCAKEIDTLASQLMPLLTQKKAEYRKKQRASIDPTCFPADMRVALPGGATESIAHVKTGDLLLTYNEITGELTTSPVIMTLRAVDDHHYLFNGRIKVTEMHRFFTDKGWKRAKSIELGDKIRTVDGGFEEVTTKEFVSGSLVVYNLEVMQNHNFFVSPDGNRAYLVHNCGGGNGGGK
jgi:hypothetical protein